VNILIAIVVGGIVGWLASLIMKTGAQMGILANIVVGIVGSALGHWLAPKLGLVPEDGVGRWLVAIAGAVLLIFVLKLLRVFR
jgi:uncharacterized membrane protein YeaQ/YmgE (transglycosylase-associated protein family)